MANIVGMLKHGLERAVVKIGIAAQHGICKIGQSAKVGIVYGLDHLDEEESVFADQIVVLKRDDDILVRGIFRYFAQASRSELDIRRGISCGGNVCTDAWRTNARSDIHPLLCIIDGLCPRGSIGIVETVCRVHGDVYDTHFCLQQNLPEIIEIVWLQGGEMTAVRLNVVNIEFRNDVGREFEQVHSGKSGVAIAVVGAQNVRAKRIRRDGDTLARMRGEYNVWFELGIRQGTDGAGCCEATSRQNRDFFQESASR